MLYASIMLGKPAPFSTEPYTLERSFAARFKPPASLYFLKKKPVVACSGVAQQLFPSGGHAAYPGSKAAFYHYLRMWPSAVDRDRADFSVIRWKTPPAGSVSDVYDLLLATGSPLSVLLIFLSGISCAPENASLKQ